MLNLHQNIINNYLNNTLMEELPEVWLERISADAENSLIHGYYNAGILVINMSELNGGHFYESVAVKNFPKICEQFYQQLKPIIETSLRRMFKGFNRNLEKYDVVLFMEGSEADDLAPVKYTIAVF